MSMRSSRDIFVLIGILVVVSALAVTNWQWGLASGLEAVSFITGAIAVWLTVKESAWNFPIGLANVATFAVVFFQASLFADAGLQVVYFFLTLAGWYLWLRGGDQKTELHVSKAPKRELVFLAGLGVVSTGLIWRVLTHLGGSATFIDALTTSMSLVAQWLLNKKRLESWIVWIIVDVIYVPMYIYKELYLTALLYVAFLVMAGLGLKGWRRSMAAR